MCEGGEGLPAAAGGWLSGAYRGTRGNCQQGESLSAQRSALVLDGLVGSISGDRIIKGHAEGNPEQGETLGIQLADDILSRGAKEILDEVYNRCAPQVNGEISS